MTEETFWNGNPTPCRKVRVVVGDSGRFPRYWARVAGLVGTVQPAVEVRYFDKPFYIDDRNGSGWYKVTKGHGSPSYPHSDFEIERIVE